MNEQSVWQYVRCKCGNMVLTKDVSEEVECSKCVKLRRPSRSMPPRPRHGRIRVHNYIDPDSLFVEYDPTPIEEGGFRKGTAITRIQAQAMCSLGTFDDGTILTDQDNTKRYKVVRYKNSRQTLRRVYS